MTRDDGARLALLTDSQATLRQVRGVLEDFERASDSPSSRSGAAGELMSTAAVAALVQLMTVTRSEITEVAAGLRLGRDLLDPDASSSSSSGSGPAAELLIELEERLARLLKLFDASGAGTASR